MVGVTCVRVSMSGLFCYGVSHRPGCGHDQRLLSGCDVAAKLHSWFFYPVRLYIIAIIA